LKGKGSTPPAYMQRFAYYARREGKKGGNLFSACSAFIPNKVEGAKGIGLGKKYAIITKKRGPSADTEKEEGKKGKRSYRVRVYMGMYEKRKKEQSVAPGKKWL